MSNTQFDPTALLEEYGDVDLVRELTELFITNCASHIDDLTSASRQRDARALKAATHKLRGTLSTFGAATAIELTTTLDAQAASGALEGSDDVVAELITQLRDLCVGARQWLAAHSSS